MSKLSLLLMAAGIAALANPAGAQSYPELRDTHDPELQAAVDVIVQRNPHWAKVALRSSVVISDVTDAKEPKTAWYDPEHMLYAASLPKIAIVLGAFVEIDAGRMQLDAETRKQLVDMVKVSSNPAASAVLDKVGIERLAEILQDPAHGKLYDPAYGGGLWVGKPYDKRPPWKRDPINNLSHGSSAMAAARLFYGMSVGTLIAREHLPLLEEMFGNPKLQHKFVKGLKGRQREIFRKSGTWRGHHSDAAIVVHPDGDAYLAVVVAEVGPEGGGALPLIEFIRQLDDVMEARFNEKNGR
jgi:beta-lactamase class A